MNIERSHQGTAPVLLANLLKTYRLHRPDLSNGSAYLMDRARRSLEQSYGRPLKVSNLSKEVVLYWLADRKHEVKPKTVRREQGSILTLWRFAFVEGYHPHDPDQLRIPLIRVPRKVPTGWHLSELERWLTACEQLRGNILGTSISKANWWRSFVLFLYDTAARPSAAMQVAIADLDLNHGCVLLRAECSKTGVDIVCHLSEQTIEAIKVHYDPIRFNVFPWSYNKRRLWFQYKQVNEAAGLPTDRYHSLGCMRRTAASHAAQHGSVDLAQRQLGHTSPVTTLRHYIDPRIAQHQPAIDVLPRPKF